MESARLRRGGRGSRQEQGTTPLRPPSAASAGHSQPPYLRSSQPARGSGDDQPVFGPAPSHPGGDLVVQAKFKPDSDVVKEKGDLNAPRFDDFLGGMIRVLGPETPEGQLIEETATGTHWIYDRVHDTYTRAMAPRSREQEALEGEEGMDDATGRFKLLKNIQETFFTGGRPGNLLYLGAGADVANPHLATGGTASMTFVDSEPFNVEIIKDKFRRLFGSDITFEEQKEKEKVVQLVVKSADSETLHTLDLRQMGYEAFFAQDETMFDVIFDKDSWLNDVETSIVHAFVSRLRVGGRWVSNMTLGGDLLRDLFDEVGIEEQTEELDEVLKFVSFGYSTAKVYEKTEQFNQGLFDLLYDFCRALKPYLPLIAERKQVDYDTGQDALGMVDKALKQALDSGSKVKGFEAMKRRLFEKAEFLKERLEELTLPEEEEEEEEIIPDVEVVRQGMQLAMTFEECKQGVEPGSEVVFTHKWNKGRYRLVAVSDAPNWNLRQYTFKLLTE